MSAPPSVLRLVRLSPETNVADTDDASIRINAERRCAPLARLLGSPFVFFFRSESTFDSAQFVVYERSLFVGRGRIKYYHGRLIHGRVRLWWRFFFWPMRLADAWMFGQSRPRPRQDGRPWVSRRLGGVRSAGEQPLVFL